MARPGRPLTGRLLLGTAVPWWHRSRWRLWRWALALGLALVAFSILRTRIDEASAVVDGLGTTRPVAVAVHDLEPGHVITEDDTVIRDLPVAAVADSAVQDEPAGRTVTAMVVAGEVVSSHRLAPDGLDGLAALVPVGRRAIAIPTPDGMLSLGVGDRVDVLDPSSGDAYADGPPATAAVVARRAPVIAVDGQSVTVVLEADEARATAAALARGTPVLALSGPDLED